MRQISRRLADQGKRETLFESVTGAFLLRTHRQAHSEVNLGKHNKASNYLKSVHRDRDVRIPCANLSIASDLISYKLYVRLEYSYVYTNVVHHLIVLKI